MFKLAIEAYILMLFTFLHLTILACDDTCLLPVPLAKRFLPVSLHEFAITFIHAFGIDYLTAQFIGQFMVIGDIFIVLLFVLKFFGAILKRFLLMSISLILTIFALQRFSLI